MNHDIYVFGSLVRGEIDRSSDADILVIPSTLNFERADYPPEWSVYSQETIRDYFQNGRLFAWHLFYERRCIYSNRNIDFISQLGQPNPYTTCMADIAELESMMIEAIRELRMQSVNVIYELGLIHVALRDIAMSASSMLLERPDFSRYAPFHLPIQFPLERQVYVDLLRARQESTRGIRSSFNVSSVLEIVFSADLEGWVQKIRRAI